MLEVNGDDDVVTYRYTAAGDGVGEVWYSSESIARAAIEAEFPELVGPWQLVPETEWDAHEYAVRFAHDSWVTREA